MNLRTTVFALIFCTMVVNVLPVANAIQDENEKLPKPTEFNARDYREDRPLGFSIAMKLIKKVEDEDADPAVVAKVRYQAAFLKRMIALNSTDPGRKDFTASIRILRGVTRKPERFLVDKDSAAWYRNCVSLLTAVYGDQEDGAGKIAEELTVTMKSVADSDSLSDEEKFRTTCDIRMAGSDAALGAEDWPAAIEWVQPIIDSADRFLDNEGAYRLAMSTRQQSMFLMKDGQLEESSQLIDSMCEKLEAAEDIDEYLRLSMQCMLRGKHLINFPSGSANPLALAGWEKYEELTEQVLAYQGRERVSLLRSYINMRRLAGYAMNDADKLLENIRHLMELIAGEPELQAPTSRVWSDLNDVYKSTMGRLTNNGDPRREEFVKEFEGFLNEYRK